MRFHVARPSIIYPFFFNDTATTEIYTLSLHDALPIFENAAASAAHTGKNIGEMAEDILGILVMSVIGLLDALMPEAIVARALIGIGKHFVCLQIGRAHV